MTRGEPRAWLPPGRIAAVCLSVDDVHPTAAIDGRAAGDVAREALDHLGWLLDRHPLLHATLFVTPDWRARPPATTRRLVQRVPVLRDWTYATRPWPRGVSRVDRHPGFVAMLQRLPRTDVALHGLHHVCRGPGAVAEFGHRSRAACRAMLQRGTAIFDAAGLAWSRGVSPPGWQAPPGLLAAMDDLDMSFIASARDLVTAADPCARTNGSGLRGLSLVFPEAVPGTRLVHITTNFQATSTRERAFSILGLGGLLSIKAHLFTRFGSYRALDGLDRPYASSLDQLLASIEDAYGESAWWPRMADVAERVRPMRPSPAVLA